MNPNKPSLFILLSLCAMHSFAQYTDVINSNRPGVSRSAFSVGTKVLQFEVGPYLINEKRTPAAAYEVKGLGADFAARYGFLVEELEFNVEGTFQNDTKKYIGNTITLEENRTNFKFLTVGAKYLLYDPYKRGEDKPNLYSWKANQRFKWKTLIPAVSIYGGLHYDTERNPYLSPLVSGFSPKVMLATQHNLNGGWVFVMNLIKDRIGTEQSDFQYIVTITHAVSEKWVIFGENQGIQSHVYADNLFRFGGAYLWSKDFQLDTAITMNTKDTPSVFSANVGMSYRFDFHKDKDKSKEVDNGNSAKEEAERKKNRAKSTDVIEDYNRKHKRENPGFN